MIRPWAYIIISATLAANGCHTKAPVVNADRARQALQTVLEAWKSGKSADDLKPIVVQDPDWSEGAELVDFERLEESGGGGASYTCKVKLQLRKNKTLQSLEVGYVVATEPATTVFREIKL